MLQELQLKCGWVGGEGVNNTVHLKHFEKQHSIKFGSNNLDLGKETKSKVTEVQQQQRRRRSNRDSKVWTQSRRCNSRTKVKQKSTLGN